MVMILFQVLEIGTTPENFENVSQAFVQLLDVLLFKDDYKTIVKLVKQFELAPGEILPRRSSERANQSTQRGLQE